MFFPSVANVFRRGHFQIFIQDYEGTHIKKVTTKTDKSFIINPTETFKMGCCAQIWL